MKQLTLIKLKWRRQFAAATVAVVLTAPMVWAQESTSTPSVPPGGPHTLDALVAEALERNPELRFYQSQDS